MYRELNLVPKVYNQVKEKKKKKKSAIIGIVILLLVVSGGIGYTIGYEFYLRVKLDKLNKQVEMNSELIAKEQHLTNEIGATMVQIEKAKSLQVLKSQKTDLVFKELQKYFPSNIKVTSIGYSKTGINIAATSTTVPGVEELWANLRESKEFKNCHISGIAGTEGSYTFNLAIDLLTQPQGGAK